jgi:hypothetical protein
LELPYTLPQDSTLFLLLRESSPAIWIKKLDWIAAHGGLALLNAHPDYMAFDTAASHHLTYPVSHYKDLLIHCTTRYSGAMWIATPRELVSPEQRSLGAAEQSPKLQTPNSKLPLSASPPLRPSDLDRPR